MGLEEPLALHHIRSSRSALRRSAIAGTQGQYLCQHLLDRDLPRLSHILRNHQWCYRPGSRQDSISVSLLGLRRSTPHTIAALLHIGHLL